MNKDALESILNEADIEVLGDRVRKEWLLFTCPLAKWRHSKGTDRRPSCGASYNNKTLVKCFSCGYKGSLKKLFLDLFNLTLDKKYEKLAEKASLDLVVPDELGTKKIEKVSLLASPYWVNYRESNEAVDYLLSRNINLEIADKYSLFFDKSTQGLIFPLYDPMFDLVGISEKYFLTHGNYFNRGCYRELGVLGGEHLVTSIRPLLIVEGWFDLLRLAEWSDEFNFDVASTMGVSPPLAQYDRISSLADFVQCWFDWDDAGEKGWLLLQEYLGKKVTSLKFREKCSKVKDPALLDKELFKTIFYQTSLKYG